MTTVISVKFRGGSRLYYFSPGELEINAGDGVIVETARGTEYGDVMVGIHDVPDDQVIQPLKEVIRVATDRDREMRDSYRAKEKDAYTTCMERIQAHGLDMKLVDVEYTFNGSKIVFYFTADGRVDFRELVKDLASVFKTRIELRQIGVRDEAKMLGGLGICGRPFCCAQFLDDLQQASDTPLFTAIDEEGGLVARLANNAAFDLPQYESAAAVGTSGNPEDARAMGRTIGGYLKEYGFNLNFAPVADVNTNPDNPVIGTRAFSSEPQTAADLVGGACAGFADAGIACTLKHFPGHGDTSEDTHVGTVTLNKTLDDLRSCELVPFAQNVNNAPLIMVAHITVPQVTGDDTPASLSSVMLTDLLRGELGYQGLIVTDSLAMQAITDVYTPGQAAVKALQAGADLLLMPNGLADAYTAVLEAVQDGTIPQQRLDESVQRILQCKYQYGILTQ